MDNHPTQKLVSDLRECLENLFESFREDYLVTRTLNPSAVNIIIDEFTDPDKVEYLEKFRASYPSAQIYVVTTEFIERKHGIEAFNIFDASFLDASAIAFLHIILTLSRKYPTDKLKVSEIILPMLYMPIALFACIYDSIRYLIGLGNSPKSRLRKYIYLVRRYLGFRRVCHIPNGIILTHEKSRHGIVNRLGVRNVLGTIHPIIDLQSVKENIFMDQTLCFEMTGTITEYRKEQLIMVDLDVTKNKPSNEFSTSLIIDSKNVDSEGRGDSVRGAFSFHPPQTRDWKYCSPIRLYRALCVDNNYPVLTRNFGQHSIEDIFPIYKENILTDLSRYYKNRQTFLKILDDKISIYNQIATTENRQIMNCFNPRSFEE